MYVIASIKKLIIPGGTSVVVGTNLSGKEPHRHVALGRMVTSGSVGGVMVSTLAWARNVCSIHTLGTIFPIFITPTTMISIIYRHRCTT